MIRSNDAFVETLLFSQLQKRIMNLPPFLGTEIAKYIVPPSIYTHLIRSYENKEETIIDASYHKEKSYPTPFYNISFGNYLYATCRSTGGLIVNREGYNLIHNKEEKDEEKRTIFYLYKHIYSVSCDGCGREGGCGSSRGCRGKLHYDDIYTVRIPISYDYNMALILFYCI